MKNAGDKASGRRLLSRRRFLELGGAGLAGVLLGTPFAGCGREGGEGLVRLVFSHGEDLEVLRD